MAGPQEFRNSREKNGIYIPGAFLSIEEIKEMYNTGQITSQLSMKTNIASCKSHVFQHMQVPFPVKRLQHVTVQTALRGIIRLEGFIPSRNEKETRPGFRDLSFWSAQISGEDIENSRQRANDQVRSVVSPEDAETFHGAFQMQFGNSPAFVDISRYGQYKFSFPLSQLLAWYGSQFCQGEEPQLRILGTELYRQEIAHYVVVHGPGTDQYNDYPEIPTVQSDEDPHGFVYWKNDTLYWRPESTSDYLHAKILDDGSVRRECYKNCPYVASGRCVHVEKGIFGPWNHLGFAFHIPPERHLEIPREDLWENQTICERDPNIYLGKEYDPDPSDVVREIREEFMGQSDKCEK